MGQGWIIYDTMEIQVVKDKHRPRMTISEEVIDIVHVLGFCGIDEDQIKDLPGFILQGIDMMYCNLIPEIIVAYVMYGFLSHVQINLHRVHVDRFPDSCHTHA